MQGPTVVGGGASPPHDTAATSARVWPPNKPDLSPPVMTPFAHPDATRTAAMLETLLTDPRAALDARLLNRDGSGLVLDRLDSDVIARLVAWFLRPPSIASGMLALRMPLLDAWLEQLAPDVPMNVDGYGRAIGGVNFVAGLVAGHWVLDREGGEDLASPAVGLQRAFDVLAAETLRPRKLLHGDSVTAQYSDTLEALMALEPGLVLVLRALFNASTRSALRVDGHVGRLSWPRLPFLAGLVAAGIAAPTPAEIYAGKGARGRSVPPEPR